MRSQLILLAIACGCLAVPGTCCGELIAGVAKVDITDREAGPVNDPLFVKALVLKNETTSLVIITVDAVAIGEIGRISNDYLPNIPRGSRTRWGFRRRIYWSTPVTAMASCVKTSTT